jgi:hypothetical protein
MRVPGPRFHIHVDDQRHGFFPSGNAFVRVMKVFARIVIVRIRVVGVCVARRFHGGLRRRRRTAVLQVVVVQVVFVKVVAVAFNVAVVAARRRSLRCTASTIASFTALARVAPFISRTASASAPASPSSTPPTPRIPLVRFASGAR